MHICPTIGPSMPCAECTPGRTYHVGVHLKNRRRVSELVFRRQGYMKAVGKAVEWWFEWIPVTPLDGTPATREWSRSAGELRT